MDLAPVYAALSAFIIAVLTGLGGYLTARLKRATTKEEVEELKIRQQELEVQIEDVQKQAALQRLYVECPNCGTEIDLSKAHIYTKENDKPIKEVESDDRD